MAHAMEATAYATKAVAATRLTPTFIPQLVLGSLRMGDNSINAPLRARRSALCGAAQPAGVCCAGLWARAASAAEIR